MSRAIDKLLQLQAELKAEEVPVDRPLSTLADRLEQAAGMTETADYAEVRRICALPAVGPLEGRELEEFCRERVLAGAYKDGFRLFPTQAGAVKAYEEQGGLFGPIGVGWGKTLISLMIAQYAHRKEGHKKVLLLVPPQVYPQLVDHDIPWARTKVPFNVPVIRLGGCQAANRRVRAKSGRPGLYIMPYSLLSVKDTVDVLMGIDADVVIADEAHMVKGTGRSARSRRLRDFILDKNPNVVALSGTITSKSVMDYHFLLKACLSSGMPLPMAAVMAAEWGEVLDAEAAPTETQTGPLYPLVRWAISNFPKEPLPNSITGFRRAYRLRLTSAPGVVSTGNAEIGTSLTVSNREVRLPEDVRGWEDLQKLISDVEEAWVTPTGDEIEHAIHTWKWLYELNSGFYNNLVWPEPEDLARRQGHSLERAAELIQGAKHAHELRQVFSRELRGFLEFPPVGLDTPLLVESDLAKHGQKNVPNVLYRAWVDWKDASDPLHPQRDSIAVRVCPFKIYPAAGQAMEWGTGGILWVHHQEIGRWLVEELIDLGVDVLHCPAGDKANREIVDEANKDKVIVASMSAHGTGKNLQHFQRQLFVQWPRQAKMAEQTLGRLHRNGQEADEIIAERLDTTAFDMLNFAACLNDAIYIHQTTGNRQKLVYATHDPLPKIYPSEFLHERGFQNKLLFGESQKLMEERFGA